MMNTPEKENNTKNMIHRMAWTICVIYFLISYALLWWQLSPDAVPVYEAAIGALAVTACCYFIHSSLQFYLPRKNQYLKIALMCLAFTSISVGITLYAINYFFEADTIMHYYSVLPYRFIINFLLLFGVMIVHIFWNIQQEYEDNKKRKEDSEKMLRDAELYNLRQQLQPHFLFNSLNSIIALIGTKPEQARAMTFQLSDFLRGTLRKDDKQLISLQDEIAHLQLYLDIEKVRFGHRLNTKLHLPDDSLNAKLPAMIIQPILENAIKFGLYNMLGDVDITVDISLEQDMLNISITNPFDPAQYQRKTGSGFGLSSIQRRMFLLYGRTDLLNIAMHEQTFTTILQIPQYD